MPGLEEAQRQMEQTLVQTEKFKAAIEKPPGMNFATLSKGIQGSQIPLKETDLYQDLGETTSQLSDGRQMIGVGTSDDDFFHLTCHIDPLLKRKIENGEFVNLDKLLPKDNTYQGRSVATNETKLE